jgi:capsular polysaccharide biosynthesis protein
MSKNKAAPKGKELKTNTAVAYQEEMSTMLEERTRNLDELAIHDEMMAGVLESVRRELRAGATPEQILEKHSALAAARIVTIAATDADSSRALSAAKDILDRSRGKAKETKDVTHRLAKVDERQIDAILLSELDILEIDSNEQE